MEINLKNVAELMNKVCDTELDINKFEGKYLVSENGQLLIKSHKE